MGWDLQNTGRLEGRGRMWRPIFFFSVKALKKLNKENVKGLLLARKACEHHWIDIQLFVQSQSGLG